GAEGKRVGSRLAEPDLVERERRAGRPQRKRCQEAYQHASPEPVEHCLSLLLGFIGNRRPPGIGMAVDRHRFFTQSVKIFDDLSVAHVFRPVQPLPTDPLPPAPPHPSLPPPPP